MITYLITLFTDKNVLKFSSIYLINEAEECVKKFHKSLKTLPPQVSEVRIIEIEGWHACACGGTHVKGTSEIREVKLLSRSSKGKGIERIEFAVQKP